MDGIIVDNGGLNKHGIAIYWKNNALHTDFIMPDGRAWRVCVILMIWYFMSKCM